jgi:hypothetical protein
LRTFLEAGLAQHEQILQKLHREQKKADEKRAARRRAEDREEAERRRDYTYDPEFEELYRDAHPNFSLLGKWRLIASISGRLKKPHFNLRRPQPAEELLNQALKHYRDHDRHAPEPPTIETGSLTWLTDAPRGWDRKPALRLLEGRSVEQGLYWVTGGLFLRDLRSWGDCTPEECWYQFDPRELDKRLADARIELDERRAADERQRIQSAVEANRDFWQQESRQRMAENDRRRWDRISRGEGTSD